MYSVGFCIAQESGTGTSEEVLPNSSRQAWASVDTGFHSTIRRSTPSKDSCGTKTLDRKVIGMITRNEALLITSGLGTSNPT